ncbi:hypothetical protein [Moheibacter stercoris]|uniref:DUF5681 domain-containing protein n=1 Tax=Moheibacter stercoris TaxID=1628251 RepID=A0ABV2LQ52_9FLAO
MVRNKNGTVKKGTVLNPKGRPKGTPNKTTAELKELIKTFVESEIEEAENLLIELTPKERLDILCKLLPYVLPKQTELISDSDRTVTINFKE